MGEMCVIFIRVFHEMVHICPLEREITSVKGIILESNLGMRRWSMDLLVGYGYTQKYLCM